MEKYLEALKGITYPEWVKLKIGIDRAFSQQKNESEQKLKLADVEVVRNLIRSQFGRT